MTLSLGEDRVRIQFNPSANTKVDNIKQLSAELINLCADERGSKGNEVDRLWSLAMTAYEEAAMWAVKAATA
jgi:hypothetical protein